MTRVREELAHRRVLDELARVHHSDAVADRRDDAEVVCHVDHRHPELGAQPAQQIEDLRLRRHIETGRRLVEHDQLRVAREGHRNHDALLLTARELVRVLLRCPLRVGQADVRDQLADPPPALAAGAANSVHRHRLDELVADAQSWGERRRGVLRDEADPPSAQLLELAA